MRVNYKLVSPFLRIVLQVLCRGFPVWPNLRNQKDWTCLPSVNEMERVITQAVNYIAKGKRCMAWVPSPYLIFQDLLRVNAIVKGEMVWVMFPCQNFLASPHQLYFGGPSVKNESQSVDNFAPWALLGRWNFLYFLRFASSERQLQCYLFVNFLAIAHYECHLLKLDSFCPEFKLCISWS